MSSIRPNREQFVEYAQSDLEGEVVMLNLLKFKRDDEGSGDDGDAADVGAEGGRAAYLRYGEAVSKMVEERGGRLLWQGQARHVFIGDPEANDWDAVALVSYPSRQAFLDMITSPDYEKAHTYREDGLERTVLIACAPRHSSF